MPSHRILLSKSMSSNDVSLYKNKAMKNVDSPKKSSRIRCHTVNGFCNIQRRSIHFPLPTINEHIQPERRSWCCNNPSWNESTNIISDSTTTIKQTGPSSPDICPKMPQRSRSITEFVDDIDLI